jgi:uncharacterized membrane protein
MRNYEASVSIAAPCSEVWRVLSDVARWPEWLPTVITVRPLDHESLSTGSRFHVRQPRLRPVTWVVTELEPPRRFVWEARSPGLRLVAAHSVGQGTNDSSALLLRFSFGGLLGGLVGRILGSITREYLAKEAASLKKKVEGSRP